MKKIIFPLVLLLISVISVSAQKQTTDLQSIESELQIAVQQEDYALAQSLKSEKEIVERLNKAVSMADYALAHQLQKEQASTPSFRRRQAQSLQAEINKANAKEDYAKAEQLKKEIQQLNSTLMPQDKGEVKSPNTSINTISPRGFFCSVMAGVSKVSYIRHDDSNMNFTGTLDKSVGIYLGARLGHQLYFHTTSKFHPGLQLTWVNIGLLKYTANTIMLAQPLHLAFTTDIKLTQSLNITAALGGGVNMMTSMSFDDGGLGYFINPELKLKLNNMQFGIDYKTGDMWTGKYLSHRTLSLSYALKF